ncbi:MAG: peptidylprolyl isomerase [Sediminimonas sp.]|uniref:peptidylprolyl isomerase n=1 Tax=Sediminimonas sp. TaxID=2823379 RepID=UPI0028701A56|nr:peptidylprolyl isomerase [Sediminimonas sp.]MDR9483586.1 peptidylprolyl isomerase [Sediminimonas sp.]
MTQTLFPDLIVNGEAVPHTAIANEAQNHDAPAGKPGIAWRKAAHAMAVRTLLLQEARHRGLTASPQDLAPGRTETEEEALIRGLLEAQLTVEAPTEAELRAEYDRDPARFRSPPLWEVSHILIECDPRHAEERATAKQRAKEIAAQAHASPKDFARLAKESSDCASGAQGGRLGQMRPGDAVPEFESVLRTMSEGEVTPDPILSRHGWHVIRLDALAEGAVLPFEAARTGIADAMEKLRWSVAARAFVADLMQRADIAGLPPVAA